MTAILIDDFNVHHAKMDENKLDYNNKIIKHIFNLNANAYMKEALPKKKKELLWLVNSLVLCCDVEGMGISPLIGGTIVIPHLRRASAYWETLEMQES